MTEPPNFTDQPAPAEAPPETSPESLLQEANGRVQALEAELQETKDKWLRSEAEMANLRARTKREVEEARLYAVQKFAKDVVEAAENIKRGIDSLPKPAAGEPEIITRLRDGFEGVERSFVGLLALGDRIHVCRNRGAGRTYASGD